MEEKDCHLSWQHATCSFNESDLSFPLLVKFFILLSFLLIDLSSDPFVLFLLVMLHSSVLFVLILKASGFILVLHLWTITFILQTLPFFMLIGFFIAHANRRSPDFMAIVQKSNKWRTKALALETCIGRRLHPHLLPYASTWARL